MSLPEQSEAAPVHFCAVSGGRALLLALVGDDATDGVLYALEVDARQAGGRLDQISSLPSLSPAEQKAVVAELIEFVRIYPDRVDISVTTTADGKSG